MTAGRLPARAAGGWSEQAFLSAHQQFLCSEGSGSCALPAAQPGKGKLNRVRAPAQPRTLSTQSSRKLRGRNSWRRGKHTTTGLGSETSAPRPGSPRHLILRGLNAPPPDAHWLDETRLGGPRRAPKRSQPRPRWSAAFWTLGLGELLWGV